MIEEVVSVELPVHERLVVRKNRLMNEENGIDMPRISIVTGTHGDELDGQYICCLLYTSSNFLPDYNSRLTFRYIGQPRMGRLLLRQVLHNIYQAKIKACFRCLPHQVCSLSQMQHYTCLLYTSRCV